MGGEYISANYDLAKAEADKVGNGQMFANFVGYDRCHVLVRDPNGNRTDNS